MKVKIVLAAILGGVIVTLLTGLISNTPPMLLGATHYGHPFAWLTRLVLAPEYFPWRIDVSTLIADIVIWTLVIGVILFLFWRRKT